MKVLFHSCVFYPSTGGVETISRTMAEQMSQMGHEVRIVTETDLGAAQELESERFSVIRKPTFKMRIKLVKQASIVFSNGASMGLFFYAKLLGKPFVWTHNGYQVSCIDGLGWAYGEPSPLSPAASIAFHWRQSGPVRITLEAFKLFLRRSVSKGVDLNIAATQWVAFRQPLPNQVQLYTPYELATFQNQKQENEVLDYDFVFVGRLVSEKGVRTLLKAFQRIVRSHPDYCGRLLIVGDGPERSNLERLAEELGILSRTDFVGRKTGPELVRFIKKAPIAIVPSEWEEPMGGVALELLAAGRTLIVSKLGGMAECMGEAALTFDNGNSESLQQCMELLVFDDELQEKLRSNAAQRLAAFSPHVLTARYIKEFERLVEGV